MSAIIFEKEEEFKEVDPLLENGPTHILQCSNCDKKLVNIWVTKPKQTIHGKPAKWNVRAECCYCGDISFTKEIVGGFRYTGFYLPNPNSKNPEDVIEKTKITDVTGEDVLTFHTKDVQ